MSDDLPVVIVDEVLLRKPDFINAKKIHVVYASSERKVTFICPECGYNRTLTESEKDQYQTSFGLDCKCGVKYECRIEFRKHYRKSVNLPGTYFRIEPWVRGDNPDAVRNRLGKNKGLRSASLSP